MQIYSSFNTVITGTVFFETIINKNGQIFFDQPGGSALYTTAGFHLWNNPCGILAKISEDKPIGWKKIYGKEGIDTTGIKTIPSAFEQRKFFVITESGQIETDNPQKHFFAQGQPIPKYLLGYSKPESSTNVDRSSSINSVLPDDIPEEYLLSTNIVLAPMDFYSHNILPPYYRSKSDGNVIICTSTNYMKPSFWYDFPALVRGSSALITTTDHLRNLFLGKNEDIWEMIVYTASCGVDVVAVFNPEGNHLVFERKANMKHEIPSYPSDRIDPIGLYETFCGAFSSGYIRHFDPVESALMGIVAASIKAEGSTPLYVLQTLPDLAEARLRKLRESFSVN